MITKKKLSYEGPVCEVFEVQSEAVMQTASPDGTWNKSFRSGSNWENGDKDYGMEE